MVKFNEPNKIVCKITDFADYREFIKKLKVEYLHERQGMLLSGKALTTSVTNAGENRKNSKFEYSKGR